MQRLKDQAEEAKIELSEVRETPILCEAITMSAKGPLTLDTTLTRVKFEELIHDLVDSTKAPIEHALSDAGLTPEKIDTVLLVGGSTRIPLVQQVVKDHMRKGPNRDISPEEVVAMGAAIQTDVMAPLGGDLGRLHGHSAITRKKMVVIHMTPLCPGRRLGERPIRPRHRAQFHLSMRSEKIFLRRLTISRKPSASRSTKANPRSLRKTPFLDLLRIDGVTPAPRGVPRIEVTFKLNPDRILEARAEDLATGSRKEDHHRVDFE